MAKKRCKPERRARRGSDIDRLYALMAKILKKTGWTVLVAGGCSIEERPPLKHNYRFVVNFMGVKHARKISAA